MYKYIVFVSLFAAGLTCQLPSECDSACSALEAFIQSKRPSMNLRYRLQYHVAPPIGWMNDPNGFTYFDGKFHLFYQYYPYDSVWGRMHWGHSTSEDLINWKTELTALIPGNEQCFSGSAIVLGNTLVLMYTAHVEGTSNDESQYLAFSNDGVHFTKYAGNPVLRYGSGLTPDFRDPKVWQHGNYWYVVVGYKTTDNKGRALLYRSEDLVDWTFLSILGQSSGVTAEAYMFECPDFFELNGKYILMMSPQGLTPSGDRYNNRFSTGYIVGSFSYSDFKFVPEHDYQEIDYGHDYYATQSTEHDGKRILIAWFGMWKEDPKEKMVEAADGWAGAMTLPRELQLQGTRILMKPVETITKLRESVIWFGTLPSANGNNVIKFEQTGELIVIANWTSTVQLDLKGQTANSGSVSVKWDPSVGKVSVDRAGDIRQVEWAPVAGHSWRIFLDTSSMELFCGNGDVVFSSRVYPLDGWQVSYVSGLSVTVEAYTLKRSVPL